MGEKQREDWGASLTIRRFIARAMLTLVAIREVPNRICNDLFHRHVFQARRLGHHDSKIGVLG